MLDRFKPAQSLFEGVDNLLKNNVGVPMLDGVKGKFLYDQQGKIHGIRWEQIGWYANYHSATRKLHEYKYLTSGESVQLKSFEHSNGHDRTKAICQNLFEVLSALDLT